MAYVLRTRGTTLPSTSSSGVFHKSFSKGSVSFSHTYVHPYLYTATSRKAKSQSAIRKRQDYALAVRH